MKIYLVRHGETDYNREIRIQGQLDVPLNEKGREQALKVAEKLKAKNINHIFSTDSKRGKQTAEIINRYHNADIVLDKRLKERQYGEWEGMTWPEVHKQNPKLKEISKNDPLDWRAPNGETMREMFKRIISFLEDLTDFLQKLKQEDSKDYCVLVVSHNSPIRTILTIVQKLPWEKYNSVNYIKNTEIYTLHYNNKELFLSH